MGESKASSSRRPVVVTLPASRVRSAMPSISVTLPPSDLPRVRVAPSLHLAHEVMAVTHRHLAGAGQLPGWDTTEAALLAAAPLRLHRPTPPSSSTAPAACADPPGAATPARPVRSEAEGAPTTAEHGRR